MAYTRPQDVRSRIQQLFNPVSTQQPQGYGGLSSLRLGSSANPYSGTQGLIYQTALEEGFDPHIAFATVENEGSYYDDLNDYYRNAGDSGNSYGPYQENLGGRGKANPYDVDPVRQTQRFIRDYRAAEAANPGMSVGQLIAAAQRPYDPIGAARKYQASYDRYRGAPTPQLADDTGQMEGPEPSYASALQNFNLRQQRQQPTIGGTPIGQFGAEMEQIGRGIPVLGGIAGSVADLIGPPIRNIANIGSIASGEQDMELINPWNLLDLAGGAAAGPAKGAIAEGLEQLGKRTVGAAYDPLAEGIRRAGQRAVQGATEALGPKAPEALFHGTTSPRNFDELAAPPGGVVYLSRDPEYAATYAIAAGEAEGAGPRMFRVTLDPKAKVRNVNLRSVIGDVGESVGRNPDAALWRYMNEKGLDAVRSGNIFMVRNPDVIRYMGQEQAVPGLLDRLSQNFSRVRLPQGQTLGQLIGAEEGFIRTPFGNIPDRNLNEASALMRELGDTEDVLRENQMRSGRPDEDLVELGEEFSPSAIEVMQETRNLMRRRSEIIARLRQLGGAEEGFARIPEGAGDEAITPPPETPTAVPEGDAVEDLSQIGGLGSAITDTMYDMLWSKLQKGDLTEAGRPSRFLQAAQQAGVKSKEELRAFAQRYAAPDVAQATPGQAGVPPEGQLPPQPAGGLTPPPAGTARGSRVKPPLGVESVGGVKVSAQQRAIAHKKSDDILRSFGVKDADPELRDRVFQMALKPNPTKDEIDALGAELIARMEQKGSLEEQLGRSIEAQRAKAAGQGGTPPPTEPPTPPTTAAVPPQRRDLGEGLMDIANLPRALKSSFDLSAPLRQGAYFLPSRPTEWMKAFGAMVKAIGSEKYAQAVDNSIAESPFFQQAAESGLYFAPRGGGSKIALNQREEAFMSRLANKLPWVKASERAYTTFLNKLRMEVFETIAKEWGPDVPAENYRSLANFINAGTGRGRLGGRVNLPGGFSLNLSAEGAGPVLNAMFFSPRFFTSRIENVTNFADPVIRKQVANALWKFYGSGAAALGLMAAAGASVELDPRSSDFGKVKFGDARYDFWAGNQQIARYMAQLATGQTKPVTGKNAGKIRPVDRYNPIIDFKSYNVVGNFIRSKLSPTFAVGADIALGKDFLGEETTPGGVAVDTLVPIFIQDLYEAGQQEGLIGALKVAPAGLGVGAQLFDSGQSQGSNAPIQAPRTPVAPQPPAPRPPVRAPPLAPR